jgi:hypothetical protein
MSKITKSSSIEAVAAIVCDALLEAGLDAVLTGGAVVSIYTENEYESFDLDFILLSWNKKVDPTMQALGFKKDAGRHWVHPKTKIFVEFPGRNLEIGNSKDAKVVERDTKQGVIRLLSPTDCIKDRLAAFYHWNDRQGLDQALMVAAQQRFSMPTVEKWSVAEGHQEKFTLFKKLHKESRGRP